MEKAGESKGAAAAPEEDDNGDDKMTEVDVEEKTSAGEHSEPKEKLAMSDVEIEKSCIQALTISSTASTTSTSVRDLTDRVSRLVETTTNQVSPSLNIDVANEDVSCK